MDKNILQFVCTLFDDCAKDLSSLAGAIVWAGEVVVEKYYGLANLEYRIPVGKETVYPLSSVTKQFTAAVILQLIEEGAIQYTDQLGLFFPDFPRYGANLTIQQVLHQVTGLPDIYSTYSERGVSWYGLTNQKAYEFLTQQDGLKFIPGGKFDYCNSNYMLLAMIAEKVDDKPFGEILKERIFTPVGMFSSFLYDARYVIPNRAYGYKKEGEVYSTVDYQWLSYGDGGIFSTLADLCLWDQALAEAKVISKKNLELAYSPGMTNNGEPTVYGFGWVLKNLDNVHIVKHNGGDPGFGSIISRIPAKECTIIMLSNQDTSWEVMGQVVRKIEEAVVKI